eukprot:6714517-Alexandrium_andersonii.AAC.1
MIGLDHDRLITIPAHLAGRIEKGLLSAPAPQTPEFPPSPVRPRRVRGRQRPSFLVGGTLEVLGRPGLPRLRGRVAPGLFLSGPREG